MQHSRMYASWQDADDDTRRKFMGEMRDGTWHPPQEQVQWREVRVRRRDVENKMKKAAEKAAKQQEKAKKKAHKAGNVAPAPAATPPPAAGSTSSAVATSASTTTAGDEQADSTPKPPPRPRPRPRPRRDEMRPAGARRVGVCTVYLCGVRCACRALGGRTEPGLGLRELRSRCLMHVA